MKLIRTEVNGVIPVDVKTAAAPPAADHDGAASVDRLTHTARLVMNQTGGRAGGEVI